ncbi:signal recognition particle-docking protein FtsY [Acholeplasma laidlawii]|uniref:signal recognition particle-docking protein FtsY n=1 Tax=Acholeplasma laidlawii TaxID=2148 RepID=UPI00084CB4DD|nr:signal recognition particle-docking protein FtsY [Acholeplasma laidlawii]OED58630.1 signal recognition particle-docking protein FtsY [Acholeplasma laidlawii]
MGFFSRLFKKKPKNDKYQMGLHKSRSSFDNLKKLLDESDTINDDLFDAIEDLLISADIGVDTVLHFTNELRNEVINKQFENPSDLSETIVDKLFEIYLKDEFVDTTLSFIEGEVNVFLFVGVNGVGKTTTIGKLAKQYKDQGKKVLMVAGDTFRAGAIEQLYEWSKRAKVDFYQKDAGSDPSSVIFEALEKAKKETYDLVLVDTAGRLQNKVNLMNELSKMKRVIEKALPSQPAETLLVIDATTGQNGMNQAKVFNEATDLTGIVLTKLDGTAKGGIVLAIRHLYNLPIKYVGLGEKIDDLVPFDIEDYIYNLFKGFF